MYKILFEKEAKKEFLKLDKNTQEFLAKKILELQSGNFANDKALKGKYKDKFRKRAGDFRIIYLKESDILLITLIRIAHRREVY